MIEKRTEFSKVIRLDGDRKRLIVSPKVPLAYKTDYADQREEWKDLDLLPRQEQGKLVVDQAPYILEAFDGTRIVYTSRKKRETMEVSIIGAAPVTPVLRDGSIWWEDVFKDTDIRLVIKPSGVEYLAVVKTPDAPKRFVWEYKTDEGVDPLQYIGTVFAQDAEKSLVKTLVATTSETKGKTVTCLLDVTFEEKKRVRPNEKIRLDVWEDGVVYPVTIDPTVNEGITTDSSDDGQEFIGFGWYPDGSVEENYVQNGAYDSDGAVRFQTVNVPNGATIDSATITVEIMYEAGSSDGAKIYGDDVDDAPAFSGSSLPSNITKTTASTTLNSIAVGSYPMDVTAIVQELVDRAGWVANNDMRFLIDYTPMASGGVWSFADTGHATGDPATLEIIYHVGGTPVGIEKDLAYAVAVEHPITKSLEYKVTAEAGVTKSLKYRAARTLFSREAEDTLNTDASQLDTAYSEQDYEDVETDDNVYVGQEAIGEAHAVHLFTYRHTDATSSITVEWKGKSDKAPSDVPVIMEIWNEALESWEELDRDDATAADTEFTLSGSVVSSPEDYYLTGNEVACRVYQ